MKDHRKPLFSSVRAALAHLDAAVAAVRTKWAERYPVPEDVDALIEFRDTAIAIARNGGMRGERKPPVTYPVTLADLTTIADAASELDGMRMFYVDQPGEQERIARMVSTLRGIAERAAAHDTDPIYRLAEEPK